MLEPLHRCSQQTVTSVAASGLLGSTRARLCLSSTLVEGMQSTAEIDDNIYINRHSPTTPQGAHNPKNHSSEDQNDKKHGNRNYNVGSSWANIFWHPGWNHCGRWCSWTTEKERKNKLFWSRCNAEITRKEQPKHKEESVIQTDTTNTSETLISKCQKS